jgi:hypothetical protein
VNVEDMNVFDAPLQELYSEIDLSEIDEDRSDEIFLRITYLENFFSSLFVTIVFALLQLLDH